MKLYHTSTQSVEHPDTLHSRDFLDFGKGFYATALREQAVSYALRFIKMGQQAFISTYEYTPNEECRIKEFDAYTEEWLDFVTACRNGETSYKAYDIVCGGVANDKVIMTINLYLSNMIDKKTALQRLIYEKPTHQLCFITQSAIDKCLHFIGCEEIKNTDYEPR